MRTNNVINKEMPNDNIRDGPGASVVATGSKHAVELIQTNTLAARERERMQTEAKIYGMHAPIRMLMERNLLAQTHRLPTLPSAHLGLQTVMGIDDELDVEEVLNVEMPEDPSRNKPLHEIMQRRFEANNSA
eukprot:GHVU01120173.1.p1 GENE.GHVU01120173.1~~GHVU01120173.1.p1  ORF type:complete len:153 (+),score=22.78 GHVU01120173.1:66-461(+)